MYPNFTAAIFIIARTWKQSRYPTTDERIKMMWYIIYKGLLVVKGNESESEGVRWMNLEPLTQSGVSQKEKNKYHILMHIYRI